jgi:hypothetical protein
MNIEKLMTLLVRPLIVSCVRATLAGLLPVNTCGVMPAYALGSMAAPSGYIRVQQGGGAIDVLGRAVKLIPHYLRWAAGKAGDALGMAQDQNTARTEPRYS